MMTSDKSSTGDDRDAAATFDWLHPQVETERAEKAVAVYREVRSRINVLDRFTPVSVDDDRAALLDYALTGRRPDLVWAFGEPDEKLLADCERAAVDVGEVLPELAQELLDVATGCRLAGSTDGIALQDWVDGQFGRVDAVAVDSALEWLTKYDATANGDSIVDAAEFARMVRVALDQSGLRSWTVQVTAAMAARVSTGVATIRVRDGATFTVDECRRLIVHEVGSHALRRANAERQRLPWLRIAPLSNLTTEEGFAVWHEARFGLLTPDIRRVYAARVIAAGVAREGGLTDVLDEIRHYLSVPLAIDVAIRAKRGWADPLAPGAFTKDAGYLCGYMDVDAVLSRDPQAYQLLMATKRPLAHLEALRELNRLNRLVPAAFLPDADRLLTAVPR